MSSNNWKIIALPKIRKVLKKCEKKDQKLLLKALRSMQANPLAGDIRALTDKGGEYRRRAGNWRIFFIINKEQREVFITDIRRRTSNTYK